MYVRVAVLLPTKRRVSGRSPGQTRCSAPAFAVAFGIAGFVHRPSQSTSARARNATPGLLGNDSRMPVSRNPRDCRSRTFCLDALRRSPRGHHDRRNHRRKLRALVIEGTRAASVRQSAPLRAARPGSEGRTNRRTDTAHAEIEFHGLAFQLVDEDDTLQAPCHAKAPRKGADSSNYQPNVDHPCAVCRRVTTMSLENRLIVRIAARLPHHKGRKSGGHGSLSCFERIRGCAVG